MNAPVSIMINHGAMLETIQLKVRRRGATVFAEVAAKNIVQGMHVRLVGLTKTRAVPMIPLLIVGTLTMPTNAVMSQVGATIHEPACGVMPV
jgi:hypothetical protein